MKKALLGSQRELLAVAGQQLMNAQGNYNRTLTMIGDELGIPEADRPKWRLSQDGQFIETVNPTPEIPGRKAGKTKAAPPEPEPPAEAPKAKKKGAS